MLDPRVKLRHLNCFLETIRLGGVARAGAALGMTQPAVSKALAELEEILAAPLFDRSRRALALTSDGEMFARFAQAGLATLQQGLDALETQRMGTTVVAFGALPTVAASLVPRALAAFSRTPLFCRTVVESGPSKYLLGLLRSAAVDFVVGRLASPEAMEGLSFEQLFADSVILVVRAGHPLGERPQVDFQTIAQYQLIMPPRGAIIRPTVDALLIANGVSRLIGEIETVSNSLARSYTLGTDAIWVISEGVVASDLAAGTMVQLPADIRGTVGPIGITTRSGADHLAPARDLLDCIRSAARQPL